MIIPTAMALKVTNIYNAQYHVRELGSISYNHNLRFTYNYLISPFLCLLSHTHSRTTVVEGYLEGLTSSQQKDDPVTIEKGQAAWHKLVFLWQFSTLRTMEFPCR